jgi:exonuclease III
LGDSFRFVSWNVANRVGEATRRQGEFLARLDPRPDVILLQEVNRRSVDALCELAGMGWWHCAVDLRQAQPDDRPVRRLGVAIAGRTAAPSSVHLLEDVPLPERLLTATLPLVGQVVHLVSYHAPPGVSWFEKKPQQAVRFARWLATLTGPAAFGADANTPLIDAVDFQQTRTHWHTGRRILRGAPGDDLLVGPAKVHPLEDVLRRWLDGHPDELDRLRVERPGGPLALSYRTGRRKLHPGTDRRFDSIWVSPQFEVDAVTYPYAECIAAGSDHAAVVADLTLPRTRQIPKT